MSWVRGLDPQLIQMRIYQFNTPLHVWELRITETVRSQEIVLL